MKNTYRVLLTRGLKGCYVTSLDPGTEAFARSRLETDRPVVAPLAVEPEAEAVAVGGTDPRLERLTKVGMEIWPLFEPMTALPDTDCEVFANDVAWLLEREDLAGWEDDMRRERRLLSSVKRAVSGISSDADFASSILAKRRSWIVRALGHQTATGDPTSRSPAQP